ncbi:hypothetical protein TNCV_635271 [Trichonephila clavipes]|nr:hypothetical protein TNCV_635271 [Trichonephila clavipes]
MFPVDKKRQKTPPSSKNREMLSGGVFLQKCYLHQKICQMKTMKNLFFFLRPFPDGGMFDEIADEIGRDVVSRAPPALSSSSSTEFLCHRSARFHLFIIS